MTPRQRASTIYGKHYQIAMGFTNPKHWSSKIVKEHSIAEIESIIEALERLPQSIAVNWELVHFQETLNILRIL